MENTFETILKQISEIQEHMQRNEADNNSQINHLLTINANQKYETVLALLELEKKNVLKMTGSYSKQKIWANTYLRIFICFLRTLHSTKKRTSWTNR